MEPLTAAPLEIPFSKKKLIFLLVCALLFVAVGCWFIISPPKLPGLLRTVGTVAVLFFGLCAWLIVRKLPVTRPGLVLDATGIRDFNSGPEPLQIPWQDMEDLWVLRIQNRKLIMIQVINPDHYIAQQQNVFKRKMMQLNHRMYGTPLSITSNALKISFDKLWQELAERFKAAKGL